MIDTVKACRTIDDLIQLAQRHAPEQSQELSFLLYEILGDMDFLAEQLEGAPQQDTVGRVIADIQVDSETLARKCRRLGKVLDKVVDEIPDAVYESALGTRGICRQECAK
jgi:hypothetical protein